MKEKVIVFLVGILLGAIISTGAIVIYTNKNNSNNMAQNSIGSAPTMQDSGSTPPSMPGEITTNNN